MEKKILSIDALLKKNYYKSSPQQDALCSFEQDTARNAYRILIIMFKSMQNCFLETRVLKHRESL